MQQKIERLQAQLGDLKGKSKDISSVSDTRNSLTQKLENKNIELEFQVLNYARENAHLKATYKNMFDSISVSLTSNSVSTPQESKGVNNDKVIAPGMFRITPDTTSREAKKVPNTVSEVISNVVCAMCSKCLISINHDKCLCNYVNDKNSRGKKQMAKVSIKEIQMKYQPKVAKPKKVGTLKRLATPKPRKLRFLLRKSKASHQFRWKFMGTVCFGNDHVAAILGFGQFYDSDLEVAFRRNACFVRNLEGVDLLKGDCSTNLYTINLYEMASASPICLMARASFTKSWLWHQRLSHLNFDTINDLARNDLVAGL
nr:hypothetical protein [Tanacetum cinerariifolium]